MSDHDFFREVDEAVRQEHYKKLWDRYGIYAIGFAVLIVAGVSAYKGWSTWQEHRTQAAGDQFNEALDLAQSGDKTKSREIFAKLAAEGPSGYATLARFQLAAGDAHAGETDKAVAAYDALASDEGVDPLLRDNAAIQAATLRLDKADYAEMEKRMHPLAESSAPWRYSARELLGLSAYRTNKTAEAEKQFSALIGDEGTPSNLRERANMMVSIIVGEPQTLSTTAK
jgi:hypothetical protein